MWWCVILSGRGYKKCYLGLSVLSQIDINKHIININKFKIGFKTRLKFYFGVKTREGFKLEVRRVIFKRNT